MVRTTTSDDEAQKKGDIPDSDPMYPEQPPVMVTQGGPGSIRVVWRDQDDRDHDRDWARMDRQDLWLVGEGFRPLPTEVVMEFNGGSISQTRISKWTEDGNFRIQLPHFDTAGEFTIKAYVPITEYGIGAPDDHRRVMRFVDEVSVRVDPMPV